MSEISDKGDWFFDTTAAREVTSSKAMPIDRHVRPLAIVSAPAQSVTKGLKRRSLTPPERWHERSNGPKRFSKLERYVYGLFARAYLFQGSRILPILLERDRRPDLSLSRSYFAWKPPSIFKTCPATKEASSESSHAMPRAISSGSPMRDSLRPFRAHSRFNQRNVCKEISARSESPRHVHRRPTNY